MERKDLEAKSKADLLKLGESLGFAVTPAMNKAEIVTMLAGAPSAPLSAQLSDMVANADDPEAAAQQAAKMAEAAAKADERRNPVPREGALRTLDGSPAQSRKYKVKILAYEGETGDVDLGVNGHLIRVKRGVEVILDEAYVHVLQNSVVDTVREDENSVRHGHQFQRYPFTAMPV